MAVAKTYLYGKVRTGGAVEGERKLAELCVLCHRFGGWTTAELAGLWMWPQMKSRTKSAERLIRRAVARGMLESYPVNNRNRVHMLTALGVEHIDRMGAGNLTEAPCEWIAKIRNAKKKGKVWRVPQYFDHHCRALRYLGWIQHEYSHADVLTEAEILRLNPQLREGFSGRANRRKCPDAVVMFGDLQIWVEVEGARKSPEDMKAMAETTVRIIWGIPPKISIKGGEISNFREMCFVIPPPGLDTRGVALNHPKRIENALASFELPRGMLISSKYGLAIETASGFIEEKVFMDPGEEGRIDRVGGVKYPV